MGGINHQPCKKYFSESVHLSRSISKARAYFEMSNVALEDALISEMSDKVEVKPALNSSIYLLDVCISNLEGAKANLAEILKKMKKLKFQDLSSIKKVDLESLGSKLFGRGKPATLAAWNRVGVIVKEDGYGKMMGVIGNEINGLLLEVKRLRGDFEKLSKKVSSPGIAKVLEQNLPGNVRFQFAQAYSRWEEFTALFLCSSLISSELSYMDQRRPSLSKGRK